MLIDNVIGKHEFIDNALVKIFGALSSKKLRVFFDELNVSTEFKDYGIKENELEQLYLSLQSNQRANNSLVKF
jgi:alcohol dehydrogenase YqhD (iron-dependent ADH family)